MPSHTVTTGNPVRIMRIRPMEDVAVMSLDLCPTGSKFHVISRPVATVRLPYDGQCQIELNEAEQTALNAVLQQISRRVITDMSAYLRDLADDAELTD